MQIQVISIKRECGTKGVNGKFNVKIVVRILNKIRKAILLIMLLMISYDNLFIASADFSPSLRNKHAELDDHTSLCSPAIHVHFAGACHHSADHWSIFLATHSWLVSNVKS
jgi:hypothetical protein